MVSFQKVFCLLLVTALALLPAGCTLSRAAKAGKTSTLSKVRIAKDRRSFVTEDGKPFVPCGVNYFRPGTGWAPQVWKQFDAEATRADFVRLKSMGMNCVRVFTSYGSFYKQPGVLEPEGLAKFDQFLNIAEEVGIYVHPTGPDHWEGPPAWGHASVDDDKTVAALEQFWKLFAARYRGRNVIFSYDLKNEPEVPWSTPNMEAKWRAWLGQKYKTPRALTEAWGASNQVVNASVPLEADALKDQRLLDYQSFRESLADEWTRRQTEAIKEADPEALVTVGLIQWSVPSLLPAGPRHYSGFDPQRQARFVDFLEIHFYPLADGIFQYRTEAEELANLSYLEGILREVARAGKPVVLAEFGWYGGGQPTFAKNLAPASEAAHAKFCRKILETSEGWVAGWLNWGFYDHPGARDCTELTGLLTADGKPKEWGKTFQQWAVERKNRHIPRARIGPRPEMDWAACLTSREAGAAFRKAYLDAFEADLRVTPP